MLSYEQFKTAMNNGEEVIFENTTKTIRYKFVKHTCDDAVGYITTLYTERYPDNAVGYELENIERAYKEYAWIYPSNEDAK
jgi:hypothetical protein